MSSIITSAPRLVTPVRTSLNIYSFCKVIICPAYNHSVNKSKISHIFDTTSIFPHLKTYSKYRQTSKSKLLYITQRTKERKKERKKERNTQTNKQTNKQKTKKTSKSWKLFI